MSAAFAIGHRIAGPADALQVLAMMRDFYAEDRIAFEPARVEAGVARLLAEPAHGEVLLWLGDADAEVLGYGVLCAGFSLEWGGAFGLIDELYLRPQARGRGLGRAALDMLVLRASERGWATVRLEVNRHNAAAKRLYLAAGFHDDARDLLTRVDGMAP